MNICSKCMLIAALSPACAGTALADFYDAFGDGQLRQNPNEPNVYDPNLWDRDNPHWTTAVIEATSSFFSAEGGSLEMRSDGVNLFASSVGAYVDSADRDANTSDTWFDSTESFYLLSRVTWPPNPNSPNDPNMLGAAILGVCVDPNTWSCYGAAYNPRAGEFFLGSLALTAGGVAQLDAADRSDLDPAVGVWMLIAHVVEASDPNDPNTVQKSLRAAVWNGGKFDWNAQYDLDYTYAFGPNVTLPAGLVQSGGLCGFATFGFPNWTSPVLSRKTDVSFDEVECRRGSFTTESAALSLMVFNAGMGTIDVEPNLPDPNDADPNMPYTMRYTLGTTLVLTATPNPGKEFNYWQVLDPNYPGDPNHGTFDSNSTLRLDMTQDTEVIAAFKCGSGLGMWALLAVFQVLVLWMVRRRRGK